ncbi:MAG: TetR/AcrR family transcriptional regulator [Acidiferrobacter sp.]
MAKKGDKTRTDIVDCAKDLFYTQGYERTSFTDIVNATGVYRGNIYHYFKSKEEILEAVIDQRLAEFRIVLKQWDVRHSTPRARLMAFVQMIASKRKDLTRYGCPIGSLNTELAKDQHDLQQSSKALFDLFRDWLTAQFIALGYAAEAESLALHLLGRAQGIAVIAHVYGDAALLQGEVSRLEAWIEESIVQSGLS